MIGVHVFTLILGAVSAAGDHVIVETKHGQISGYKERSTKGKEFYTFHNLPYAKPPVGSLRLKDPVAPEGWTGVRDGSVVPPLCPQIPFLAAVIRKPIYEGNEDCLYLSVFTSKPGEHQAKLPAKLPVMVFIHGGAFFAGGINKYTPSVLLNEDIVFVLLQYRLGILGFLSTEDNVIPGNFGLKDQVFALKWIQENIDNFGGDKDRVTVFGESAGGASTHFHLISPHSEGLFSRAILQSGTLLSPWAMGGAFREVSKFTGNLFSCPSWDPVSKEQNSISLLSCLQDVDTANLTLSLMNHIHWNFNPVLLGPRVDGDFIPEEVEILVKEGRYNKVDLISGITKDEGGLFVFPLYHEEELKSDLLNNFEEMGPASLDITYGDTSPVVLAQKIFNYYVGDVKAESENADDLCKMYGDWQFNVGHDLVAEHCAKNAEKNKIYLYEVNHRGQRSFGDFYDTDVGKDWVTHADELFYLFSGDNLIWKPLDREEDHALRDIMTKLWYNFAATGNPTPDGSLGFMWNAVGKNDFSHLSLTPSPKMEGDKREEVRKFLNSLPTKQNYLLHPEKVSVHEFPVPQGSHDKARIINTSPRKYGVKDEL